MKVLIVRLSPIELNDSANIRTLGLVKGLVDIGCHVDYLTVPNNSNNAVNNIYESLNLNKIIRSGSNSTYQSLVKPGGKLKSKIVQFIRNIYRKVSLFDHTYSIAKSIDLSLLDSDTKYDLVISSSDPKTSHLAVKNLIKQGLNYKRWIQYWGDPMAMDITKKSIYPKRIVASVEHRILNYADYIVYVSPFTLHQQKRLFKNISNNFYFLPIPYITEKNYGVPNNDKFTIGYFGAYYSWVRNIKPLYNVSNKMRRSVNLKLVGDTDTELKETDNISILPRKSDITEIEKSSDLLVCILNKRGNQIPGKIYHAAGTDKPILVVLDGEKKQEIKEYLNTFQRFIICDNNEASIENAINYIMKSNQKYEPSLHFKPEKVARDFIDILSK